MQVGKAVGVGVSFGQNDDDMHFFVKGFSEKDRAKLVHVACRM